MLLAPPPPRNPFFHAPHATQGPSFLPVIPSCPLRDRELGRLFEIPALDHLRLTLKLQSNTILVDSPVVRNWLTG